MLENVIVPSRRKSVDAICNKDVIMK